MVHSSTQQLKAKFAALKAVMDERTRRLWAATEARALGWGGISRVAAATGLTRVTIRAGLQELAAREQPCRAAPVRLGRQRRSGGGRKRLTVQAPDLLRALEVLVDPVTRGDPQSPLRWTCKSAAKLAAELRARGHVVSPRTVNTLLHDLGYSLQANRKTLEGSQHPDRNTQFRYINRLSKVFQRRGQPVVSVDTKKKELGGHFQQGGREWQPVGQPHPVLIYDFVQTDRGKAIPDGIYDPSTNQGWVSVGVDHDTAVFAVETLRRWWLHMGSQTYPQAKRLLITADGGGSNGSRYRLWKVQLQQLADETGLTISVCHFPPGTSKWNKIEHRLFCHITENWRGRPLISHAVVVNLIGSTTTTTGLKIRAELDEHSYPPGQKVTAQQMNELSIKRHKFHGEWNYTIMPQTRN